MKKIVINLTDLENKAYENLEADKALMVAFDETEEKMHAKVFNLFDRELNDPLLYKSLELFTACVTLLLLEQNIPTIAIDPLMRKAFDEGIKVGILEYMKKKPASEISGDVLELVNAIREAKGEKG